MCFSFVCIGLKINKQSIPNTHFHSFMNLKHCCFLSELGVNYLRECDSSSIMLFHTALTSFKMHYIFAYIFLVEFWYIVFFLQVALFKQILLRCMWIILHWFLIRNWTEFYFVIGNIVLETEYKFIIYHVMKGIPSTIMIFALYSYIWKKM